MRYLTGIAVGARLVGTETRVRLVRGLPEGEISMDTTGNNRDVIACRLLRAEITRGPAGTVLALDGEIDPSSAPTLDTAVARCLEEGPRRLTVDVGAVEFCDCSGVRALTGAAQTAEAEGIGFILRGVDARMLRLLTLTDARDLLAAAQPKAATVLAQP